MSSGAVFTRQLPNSESRGSALIIASAAVIMGVAAAMVTDAPALPLILVSAATVLFAVGNLKLLTSLKQWLIYTLAFGVKWLLVLYQSVYKNLPLGGSDWELYHYRAEQLNLLHESTWDILSSSSNLFIRLVGAVYHWFGVYPVLIYFLVFATSLVTFRYIYLATLELTQSRRLSQTAALLFMVWPIEVIHSVTFLREMPIQMLVAISFYYFALFADSLRINSLIIAVLFAGLSAMMHSGMIVVMFVYLFVGVSASSRRGVDALNPLRLIVFALLVVLLLTSPVITSMTEKFDGVSADDLLAERHNTGRTSYVTGAPSSLVQLIIWTPYRVTMYALSPLPWQVASADSLLAWLLDGLLRIWLVYHLVEYLVKSREQTPKGRVFKTTLMLVLVLTYVVFALGTFNYGTAMRHRTKIFPIEIIGAYACGQMLRQRQSCGSGVRPTIDGAFTDELA